MAENPSPRQVYQAQRRRHWDGICRTTASREKRTGHFYHHLLARYYRALIPPGLTVLELGCGQGDLLNALNPERGVGVDFSIGMLTKAREKYPHLDFVCADAHQIGLKIKFDVIILSDLVNDLWDVQSVLARAASFSHAGTRLIINFFNNMWRIPLNLARKYHLAADLMEQNWLTPPDMTNLLRLAGFEQIRSHNAILFPAPCPVLEPLLNRFFLHLPPFHWLGLTNFMIARPVPPPGRNTCPPLVSIIIPARNEAGNIHDLLQQTVIPGYRIELIFVEGGSTDGTHETICQAIAELPESNCRLIKQPGKGKADAVKAGFQEAAGDILIILDADLTVPPEDLSRFVDALVSGAGDFINGVRLVYPMENQSMRFLNMIANKIFSLLFSWLLGQPVKDTLCGTKALWKKDYEIMKNDPGDFSLVDPFGDFALLLSAARLNLKITDLPVRYRRRKYGFTNISRWHHGWLLLKMAILTAGRIKFL
ncbi:MAG: glycosyltransferase [Thermodesulfobacteriota bacterium]